MELVLAILALHGRKRLIALVQHAVANETLLNTLHLFVDVRLPKQNCSDDVPIAGLE